MQADHSNIRRGDGGQGEPRFDPNTVRVSKRPANTGELLNLRWCAREGQLIPSHSQGQNLTSIFNVSRRFTQSLRGAGYELDDLVQESFVCLLTALPSFRSRSSLNTYSDRVVMNGLLDLLDGSNAKIRLANSETVSLVLDGDIQENELGMGV